MCWLWSLGILVILAILIHGAPVFSGLEDRGFFENAKENSYYIVEEIDKTRK